MDTDLYKFQQQNFLTVLTYFNKTKEKAENYYLYIQKYKEYTSQYLTQIKQLYSFFSPSLYNKNLNENININEENKININNNGIDNDSDDDIDDEEENGKNIFDLDIENNKLNISNISLLNNSFSSFKNDKKHSCEIDLSPIYKMTNIIFKQFKNQINGLKLFLKGIDLSIENFKKLIEQTKADINKLKLNYLDIKQNFFENISSYKKNNEELLNDYSKIESKIIQICIIKDNEDALMNNKNNKNKTTVNDLENTINLNILDLKTKEGKFNKIDKYKKIYCEDFRSKSEECLIGMKNNTILIIENMRISIGKFLSYYTNCYHLNYKDLSSIIKIVQEMKNEEEYQNILKQILKEINDNIINLSNEQIKLKKYNVRILENKDNIKITLDKLVKIGYNFKNDNIELSENDLFYIMKKMYNFDLVNKDNYNIDKESKKLMILNWFVIMFNLKNSKNIIKEKSNKIISDEKLYNIIESDKDYRIYFLKLLGNKRADAILELPKSLFNTTIKIFMMISDKILNEKEIDTAKYLLILSQTYYKVENDKKIYIHDQISEHPLYQKEDFWTEYIKSEISFALKKKEMNEQKIGRKLNEDEIIKRNNDIVFAQLITLGGCMHHFCLSEEKIINILTPFFEEYKLIKENIDSILSFIKSK